MSLSVLYLLSTAKQRAVRELPSSSCGGASAAGRAQGSQAVPVFLSRGFLGP